MAIALDAFESPYPVAYDGIYVRLTCWITNALLNGTLDPEAIEVIGVDLPVSVLLQVTGLRSPQKARAKLAGIGLYRRGACQFHFSVATLPSRGPNGPRVVTQTGTRTVRVRAPGFVVEHGLTKFVETRFGSDRGTSDVPLTSPDLSEPELTRVGEAPNSSDAVASDTRSDPFALDTPEGRFCQGFDRALSATLGSDYESPAPKSRPAWMTQARILIADVGEDEAQRVATWLFDVESTNKNAIYWRERVLSLPKFRGAFATLAAQSKRPESREMERYR